MCSALLVCICIALYVKLTKGYISSSSMLSHKECGIIYFTSWANVRVKLHSQVHFGSKKVLGPKQLGVIKNLESNKFWIQNNVEPKKSKFKKFRVKKILCQKNFGLKKFCVEKSFWSKKSCSLGPAGAS